MGEAVAGVVQGGEHVQVQRARVREEHLAELGGNVHNALDVLVAVLVIEIHVILDILDVGRPVLVLILLVPVTKEQVKYGVGVVLITLIELGMILIIIVVMIISDIFRVKADPISIVFMRAAAVRLTLAVTINLEACIRADSSVSVANERPSLAQTANQRPENTFHPSTCQHELH